MSRFAPALRELARALDLPREERAAIVRELAADLDALYAHHRARGADEPTAQRLAEEAVLGSGEVVRRLARLHRRSWRDWPASLGTRMAGGADLVMLLFAVVPMLVLGLVLALGAATTSGGAILWVLSLLGVGLIVAAAHEALRVHTGSVTRSPGALLPVLSSVAAALGLLGAALGLYATSQALASGASDAALQVTRATVLGRAAVASAIGVLLAIAGVFAWFLLAGRAAARIAREVDALLAGDGSAPHPGGADVLHLPHGRSA